MTNDRGAAADAIAAAYWASVARLGDRGEAGNTVVEERRTAETQRSLTAEQALEVERVSAAEDDETKRQAKTALRPRLRPRL